MELQLEDYWKIVRPQRAKPVGGHLVTLKALEPLVEWVRNLWDSSPSYQVLPGDNRLANFRYLRNEFQLLEIIEARSTKGSDLTDSVFQLLKEGRVHRDRSAELTLDFEPPIPVEWDLIWCFLAIPDTAISSNLMDAARKDGRLIKFYNSLTELRLEASEKRALISLEEGIQSLAGSISKKKRERLDTLFFLLSLASENGLVDPFLVYLDTKDTTVGLLEILQASREWEAYSCPVRFLIGCQDISKLPSALHQHIASGLEWMSPA
jgi:hypothetical protein